MAVTKSFVGREMRGGSVHPILGWGVTAFAAAMGIVLTFAEFLRDQPLDALLSLIFTLYLAIQTRDLVHDYRSAESMRIMEDHLVICGASGETRLNFSDIIRLDRISMRLPCIVLQDNTKVPVPDHYQLGSLAKWIEEQKALKALTSAAHPASESSPSHP